MNAITLHGKPVHIYGSLPPVGNLAPVFTITDRDMEERRLIDYNGWRVLNIFPSIDTPVCAASVREFNAACTKFEQITVLCISADLPFAQVRFCGAEGLTRVETLSVFRHPEFGERYGLLILDGPLAGLLARAVFVVDPKGKIIYEQLVPEISQEPDYQAALAVLL